MHTPRRTLNQTGIVSMMVAVILMAVMTLIVLGFAEISRRDQRETLDRQLSSQAFYAAETGVNDAQHIIETDLNNGTPPPSKGSCAADGVYVTSGSNVIDSSSNVQYTCLLVNTTPDSLLYTLYPGDTSKVFPLESANGSAIHSVQLQWKPSLSASSTPRNNCPNPGNYKQLPPAGSWRCGYGVLRVDLVPENASTTNRDALLANTFTAFFVPTTSGSSSTSVNFNGSNLYSGSTNQGVIAPAGCGNSSSGACTMTININSTSSATYYMRVSTIYQDTSLNIFAYSNTGGRGNQLALKNAQALVDVTGQAQDILRRIQVRIPVSNSGGLYSDYALQTTDPVCKQFTTYPGFAQDASGQATCTLP